VGEIPDTPACEREAVGPRHGVDHAEEDAVADCLEVTHFVLRLEQEQWSAALIGTSIGRLA